MSASLLFFSSTLVYITVSARTPPRARARPATSLPLWPTGCTGTRGGEPPGTSRARARARARLAWPQLLRVLLYKGCTKVYTLRSAPHRRAALKGPLLRARHGARHASWRPYTCVLLFTYFVFLNCIQFSTYCEGSSLSRSRTHTILSHYILFPGKQDN